MQFITNGPDIPDALVQAHEEGRVVFFCGAGISYPAGLPGFKGLVEKIYRECGTTFSEIEKEAFDRGQFDATLDLLEHRLPGQRLTVRRALAKALKPKLRRKGAIDTQAALLCLAGSRDGALRMVTTNFDSIFNVAAKRTGQTLQSYAAPMLPIPKNSRWNGLVYLHGLLPNKEDDTSLNRLVVTSGDFGLAYLTERWAARFVSELFRNYVVCFVGYSINDPVLRYMMDALAADRMLGEVTPQAWALGDCEPGEEHRKSIEWGAKGVRPILYEVPTGTHDHSGLHKTLHAWAETYRDGVQGKEAIVVKHALTQPQASTQQDDFVGRMLWALSDKSGLPAKRFADFNPAPSLDWLLESFAHENFEHSDLARLGVPPRDEVDAKLCFSLVRRPAPYDRAPPMLLVSGGVSGSQWDEVMFQLARWLTRHLNDPRLVIWIAERGGQLHDRWSWLIENELDRFFKLEQEGNTSELDEIRSQAPMAIPSPLMKTFWRLLLSSRVKSPWHNSDLYHWQSRLKREGLTTTLRLELRELLSPKVAFKKPFRWNGNDSSIDDEPSHIRQLVDWELVLAADHVHSALQDMADPQWTSALPLLLEDFQQLLRDALDVLREVGEANDQSDRSHWDLPSISPHWQNRGYHDWVSLIELLRDSWLALHASDNARSTRIAQAWFDFPYPTFKRLALFAASQDNSIQPRQWVEWLLSDGAWWLWSTETGREVYRLLVLKGRLLDGTPQERLEVAILAGPPREMYRDDLEHDRWQDLLAHSVWLHLAKLNSSGLALGEAAAIRLAEISNAFPQWQLAANESDEFSHWMSGTGDPDYEDKRDVDIAPRKRKELVKWLSKPVPERRPFYEDTWRDVCRTRFFHSIGALYDLSQRGEWPTERWREALQVWAEDSLVSRAWRYIPPLVQAMPDAVIKEIAHSITWWLEKASKDVDRHEDILLNLCGRVLALDIDAGTGGRNGQPFHQPVMEAINHPVGHVTQAIINLWFKQNPNDNDLLPANIKPFFTSLCNIQVVRFRHGRVLLGSRLIALFRVDRIWTEQHLLPLFSWGNLTEAKAVWEGFLWSPRLYQPLLIEIKQQLLDSANHYTDLGEHRQQFAAFLTYVALGPAEGYTVDEFRAAIGSLPQEGLEKCAQALSQALKGAGEQREDYWKNRAQPFWQKIWPKSRDLATPRIAESLARLVIAARGEFPAALAAVFDWLQPIEHPHYVVRQLHGSGLCSRFPNDALLLLNVLISEQQWAPRELGQCLDEIAQAGPQLARDAQYQRLYEYFRMRRQ
ncbi:anti-phage defense-associated sirtuin Dsr1 [Halomonas sp. A11-A]|uniref:anti-phage defense-associated sirtuin Dsr1 n=1 Tax=Halomonas sp. A11-A TaxID=2183985 RepID=UPI000D710C47|nr:anti-phage defense-associated sirtuin Dsr1 [Halomonas sp. A11-A]PWV74533.1 SIR2-like protein [Halomonas sp. A11-A]